MTIVNLEKRVPGSVLEKALISAAKDVGLIVGLRDETSHQIDLPGAKEREVYRETVVELKKSGFFGRRLVAEAKVKRDRDVDWFSLCRYGGYDAQKYLEAVSKMLKSS